MVDVYCSSFSPENSILGEKISEEQPKAVSEIVAELRELPGSPKISPVGNWLGASGNLTPPAKDEKLWF